MTLFSYVVQHDLGMSPNPTGGFCTLAFCKFSQTGTKSNIVELAKKGDWVVGTGGKNNRSSGHGTLVYAMKVTDKMPLATFLKHSRFKGRYGNDPGAARISERYALISDHYYYFGSEAKPLEHDIEKTGPSFRSKFSPEFIDEFVAWLEAHYELGEWGDPCVPPSEEDDCPPSPVCRRRNSKSRRRLKIIC